MDMIITSSAFPHNGAIPKAYTCEGRDISPPLAWNGIPGAARSLVLIVDDPDAPDPQAPRMTWVHWVLYNLPVSVAGLPEAVRSLPAGALEGVQRLAAYRLRRPVSPDRAAPLLPQALCA